jgi:hypothetical protein
MQLHALGHHHAGHLEMQVRDDEPRKRQGALEPLLAVDDEELVGVVGELVEAPQVARRSLQGHVVAHRDVVEVHERADGALGVGERRPQALALLRG